MAPESGTASARRLLFITYEFPPKGGSGVQRVAKFVKYLPRFGWMSTVLTVADPPASLLDASLCDEIPEAVKVETAWSLEPTRLYVWVRNLLGRNHDSGGCEAAQPAAGRRNLTGLPIWAIRLIQAFFVPDEKIGWKPYALRAARRVIERDRPDAILTSGPPFTAHLVGRALKKRTRLPWVADFRDPWVGHYFYRPQTPLHAWLVGRQERRVVESADVVVSATEGMTTAFRERYPSLAGKIVTITNGFDPDDFAQTARPSAQFTLTFAGLSYFTESMRTFMDALASLIDAGEVDRGAVQVRFVGGEAADLERLVEENGLADVVMMTGYVAHREAVRHLLESDVLLLFVDTGAGSRVILTGKLLEYLAAGKPVLAIAPPGDAASLVQRAGIGTVVPPGDIDATRDALRNLYRDYQRGDLSVRPAEGLLTRFDRRALTGQLAAVLDRLCVGEGGTNGRRG